MEVERRSVKNSKQQDVMRVMKGWEQGGFRRLGKRVPGQVPRIVFQFQDRINGHVHVLIRVWYRWDL